MSTFRAPNDLLLLALGSRDSRTPRRSCQAAGSIGSPSVVLPREVGQSEVREIIDAGRAFGSRGLTVCPVEIRIQSPRPFPGPPAPRAAEIQKRYLDRVARRCVDGRRARQALKVCDGLAVRDRARARGGRSCRALPMGRPDDRCDPSEDGRIGDPPWETLPYAVVEEATYRIGSAQVASLSIRARPRSANRGNHLAFIIA